MTEKNNRLDGNSFVEVVTFDGDEETKIQNTKSHNTVLLSSESSSSLTGKKTKKSV